MNLGRQSTHTFVKRSFLILLLLVSCGVALGMRVLAREHVQVTPANAKEHEISFSYGKNSDVLVVTPYTKGELTFDSAELKFKDSSRHFSLPIKGMRIDGVGDDDKKSKDMLLIAFWMDKQTLRDSSLELTFCKSNQVSGIVYSLLLKDFIPKGKAPPNK